MERPDSLDTSDITGATTKIPLTRSTSHPFNTNTDIERSTPFRYSRGTLGESQRHTDCLTPNYKLPSFTYHPLPPLTAEPRDVLWTIEQKKWKPASREHTYSNWSDAEKFGRDTLFQRSASTKTSLQVADITGPQFRIEEKRWRKTDPLAPVYVYDGNTVEGVRTRRPHYGSQFPRTEQEAYALRTDDILTEKVFNREYPKALIKTRTVNRTDDITGAQADTRSSAPKLWKIKDPMLSATKLTNRVIDIDGAVAGTGGQGPLLYRARKQASAIAAANAARTADIAAVRALK